jgi:hypothetical protein
MRRAASGIKEGRAHAGLAQRRHLVLHERDQRRDDDARPGARDGRNLEAQGLAAAGGHEHQRIAAAHEGIDHLRLRRAEMLVAENAAQNMQGFVVRPGRSIVFCHHEPWSIA